MLNADQIVNSEDALAKLDAVYRHMFPFERRLLTENNADPSPSPTFEDESNSPSPSPFYEDNQDETVAPRCVPPLSV